MRFAPFLLALGTATCLVVACDGDDDVVGIDDGNDASASSSSSSSGRSSSSSGSSSGSSSSSSSSSGSSSSSSSSSSGDSGVDDGGTDGGHPTDVCIDTDAGEPLAGEQCSDCFYNLDCDDQLRCECNPDSEDVRCFCLPGTRGAGGFNDECANENDCATGLCIAGDQGSNPPPGTPNYCSKDCGGDQDCAAPLSKCNAFLGVCIPPN